MRPLRMLLLTLVALAAAALGGTPAAARAAARLVVFGDSYSIPVHSGTRDWPLLLRDRGLVGRIDDFARFGATAWSGWHINFAQQLQRWRANGRPLGMTVVYLGFNDIGGDMAGARAGVAELVAAGAASGGNRLLLIEPHDVGSTPLNNRTAKRGFLRRQTRDWGGFVAFTAHHVGAVPVDVLGAIDRVLAHPGRYGFTNVTTADHAHAATTALYADAFHVGRHGQEIIADTIAARLR